MIKKNVFLSFFIFLTTMGYSQVFERYAVSLNTEAIGLPFTNYSPIHPGIEISGTIRKKDKAKSVRYTNLKVGFFHHQKIENAIYLGVEYQYSRNLFTQKLSLDLPVGLGYLCLLYTSDAADD